MAELEKIIRVIRKLDPTAPHSVLLTLDATTGQNAVNQVEIFGKRAGVTGLVMTKLDGTARGGILVAIAAQLRPAGAFHRRRRGRRRPRALRGGRFRPRARRRMRIAMTDEPINLADKLATFADHFSPRTLAEYNGHDVMVAKLKGPFVWHKHDDTDDFFLVLKGTLRIELRDRTVTLSPARCSSCRRASSIGRSPRKKCTSC